MDAGQLLTVVLMLAGACWAAYLAFSDWRPPGPQAGAKSGKRPPSFSLPQSFAGDDAQPPGWIVTRKDYTAGEPRITQHWGRTPEDARRAAER